MKTIFEYIERENKSLFENIKFENWVETTPC